MSTQRIILTVGIPASGKDTWANEVCEQNPNDFVIVNRDELRKSLYTWSGSIHDYKYSKSKEKFITETQMQGASLGLNNGRSVIVSDTNLNERTRKMWAQFAHDNGVPITYEVMDTPLHVCIKRNAKRDDYVPESVLIRMERKMREYCGKYIHDKSNSEGLPECVIFDIDGTLADHEGIRSSFEWSKVGQDRPRKFVVDYYKKLCSYYKGTIIIFSGRDSVCRQETLEWLHDFAHVPNELYMREEGSMDNDCIVKEKMFDTYIKGKYHVSHIVDDRKQVCQMWESMGFDVMNVGGYLADF